MVPNININANANVHMLFLFNQKNNIYHFGMFLFSEKMIEFDLIFF